MGCSISGSLGYRDFLFPPNKKLTTIFVELFLWTNIFLRNSKLNLSKSRYRGNKDRAIVKVESDKKIAIAKDEHPKESAPYSSAFKDHKEAAEKDPEPIHIKKAVESKTDLHEPAQNEHAPNPSQAKLIEVTLQPFSFSPKK